MSSVCCLSNFQRQHIRIISNIQMFQTKCITLSRVLRNLETLSPSKADLLSYQPELTLLFLWAPVAITAYAVKALLLPTTNLVMIYISTIFFLCHLPNCALGLIFFYFSWSIQYPTSVDKTLPTSLQ